MITYGQWFCWCCQEDWMNPLLVTRCIVLKLRSTSNERVACLGPHENTRVISWLLAKSLSAFLREGLAMYMDASWWGKATTWWCKQFLKEGFYIPIANLLENECFFSAPCEDSYPIAGALTATAWILYAERPSSSACIGIQARWRMRWKEPLSKVWSQGRRTFSSV